MYIPLNVNIKFLVVEGIPIQLSCNIAALSIKGLDTPVYVGVVLKSGIILWVALALYIDTVIVTGTINTLYAIRGLRHVKLAADQPRKGTD